MATIVIKDKNLVPENIKKGVTILKVTGTYEGGTEINNQNKTVDASTVQQIVTADASYTGLGSVTVRAASLQSKTVDPDPMWGRTYTADEGYIGLSSVKVNRVDASIDSNLVPGNIKNEITILGVRGTYRGHIKQEPIYVNPSTNMQLVSDDGFDGISSVIVNPVDSSADANLVPGNIKNGVTIFGVTGSYVGESEILNQSKSVTPRKTMVKVQADAGYTGMDEVTVYAVDSSIDSNITPENIKSGVNILGVTGAYDGSGGGGSDVELPGETDAGSRTLVMFPQGTESHPYYDSKMEYQEDKKISAHDSNAFSYGVSPMADIFLYAGTDTYMDMPLADGYYEWEGYPSCYFWKEIHESGQQYSFTVMNKSIARNNTMPTTILYSDYSKLSLDGTTWSRTVDITNYNGPVYCACDDAYDIALRVTHPNMTMKSIHLLTMNVMIMPEPVTCYNCEGTGVDPNTGETCDVCGGSGEIW